MAPDHIFEAEFFLPGILLFIFKIKKDRIYDFFLVNAVSLISAFLYFPLLFIPKYSRIRTSSGFRIPSDFSTAKPQEPRKTANCHRRRFGRGKQGFNGTLAIKAACRALPGFPHFSFGEGYAFFQNAKFLPSQFFQNSNFQSVGFSRFCCFCFGFFASISRIVSTFFFAISKFFILSFTDLYSRYSALFSSSVF